MPQAMYKREKKVHLTTSAVKIGYKHLWNSKLNFWMLKQPNPFLRLCTLHSSSVSENTEKKKFRPICYSGRCPLFRQEIRFRYGMESRCPLSPSELIKRRASRVRLDSWRGGGSSKVGAPVGTRLQEREE